MHVCIVFTRNTYLENYMLLKRATFQQKGLGNHLLDSTHLKHRKQPAHPIRTMADPKVGTWIRVNNVLVFPYPFSLGLENPHVPTVKNLRPFYSL